MDESANEALRSSQEPEKDDAADIAASKCSSEGCKYCSRCGRRLSLDAAYCDGCGHMQGSGAAPRPVFAQRKSYRPEKISDIVGKERAYYNGKFGIMSETGTKACFNPYACLGWFWFAYRKMPVEAAVCFGAYIVLGTLPVVGKALQLGLLGLCGAFGNYIYLKHIERTIDRIDAMMPRLRNDAVREYAGVSGILLIIAFLISGMFIGGFSVAEMVLSFGTAPIRYTKHIF